MNFEIIGDITNIEIIAVGNSIRELERLGKRMFEKFSCWYQNVLDPPKSPLKRGTLIPVPPFLRGVRGDLKVPKVTAKHFSNNKTLSIGVVMQSANTETQYVVCISNKDYPASLEIRKIYQTVSDSDAVKHQMIRVIDESGEDYLYPNILQLYHRSYSCIADVTLY